MCGMLLEVHQSVPWFSLVWHKARIPKHAFTVWRFVLNRNATLDRLHRWVCDVEQVYLLCGEENETRNHLFFKCSFSKEIWMATVQMLHLSTLPTSWENILQWLPFTTANRESSLALLQGRYACVYEIWMERNRRCHTGLSLSPSRIFLKLLLEVKK